MGQYMYIKVNSKKVSAPDSAGWFAKLIKRIIDEDPSFLKYDFDLLLAHELISTDLIK